MPTVAEILCQLRARRDHRQAELIWLDQAITALEKLQSVSHGINGHSPGKNTPNGLPSLVTVSRPAWDGVGRSRVIAGYQPPVGVQSRPDGLTFRQVLYRSLAVHRRPMSVRDLETALQSGGYTTTSRDLNKTIRRFVYTDGRIRKVGPGRFKLKSKLG